MDHNSQRGARQDVGGMNAIGTMDSQNQHHQREPLRSPTGPFSLHGPTPSSYSRPFSPLPPTFGPYATLSVTENGDLRQTTHPVPQYFPGSSRGHGGAYSALPEPSRLGGDAGGRRTPAGLLPPLSQNARMPLSSEVCPGRSSLNSANPELASIRQRSLADILQSGSGLYPSGVGPLPTGNSHAQTGSHSQPSNQSSPRRRAPHQSSWYPYRTSRSDAPSRFDSQALANEQGAPTSPPPSVDRRRSRHNVRARRPISSAIEANVATHPAPEISNQPLFMVGRQPPVDWDHERDQSLELNPRARAPRGHHSGSSRLGAFKARMQSLQTVAVDDLPEGDRCCSICYNPFGEEGPEGITETPLRLPRCEHVFGDHCIRRWLTESDKCPYCRVKVPGLKKDREPGFTEPMIQAWERMRQDSFRHAETALQTAVLAPGVSIHGVRFYPGVLARDELARLGRLRTPPSDAEDGQRRTRQRLDSDSPEEEEGDESEDGVEREEGELHDPAPPYVSDPTDEAVLTPYRVDPSNMYHEDAYFDLAQASAPNSGSQNLAGPPRVAEPQPLSPTAHPDTSFASTVPQPPRPQMPATAPESPTHMPSDNQRPRHHFPGLGMTTMPAPPAVPGSGPPLHPFNPQHPCPERDVGRAFFENRPAVTFMPPPQPSPIGHTNITEPMMPPELRPANGVSVSPLPRGLNHAADIRGRMW